jgi:predicted Zn finger-like uncharacterized protein
MPVSVSCPSCERKLRVPDELLGKRVKCPGCKNTFTAEDPDAVVDVDVIEEEERPRRPVRRPEPPQDDEGIQEERRPAQRRRREAEDDDEEYEEERPRRRKRRSRSKSAARQAVAIPAIGLMVVAGLGLVLNLIQIVWFLRSGQFFQVGPRSELADQPGYRFGEWAAIVVGLCWSGIVLTCAVKLKNLSSFGYSCFGAILAMLPCSACCLLGLPFGIWALVAMNREDVKRAFG